MKKFIFLLLAVILSCNLMAQESVEIVKCLTVNLSNGTAEHYRLSDEPVVTFPGSSMKVKCNEAEASWERSDVKDFTVEEVAYDALDAVGADGGYEFSYVGGKVMVSGAPSVTIYDATGKAIIRLSADKSGLIEVDFTKLPSAIYIVSPEGHTSVKIKK